MTSRACMEIQIFMGEKQIIKFAWPNRRPREEETKAEPDPSPNSNPTIACKLLAPVLKYKTRGTTGRLFLKYKTRDNHWLPVPKVQDPGQTISGRNHIIYGEI